MKHPFRLPMIVIGVAALIFTGAVWVSYWISAAEAQVVTTTVAAAPATGNEAVYELPFARRLPSARR
jgi:ABC-type sulfate transport system permease component